MKIRIYLAVVFVFSMALGSTQARVRPQRTAPPDITTKAVAAAQAFLATLDARQRAAVVMPLNKDTRSRWSNLPNGAAGLTFKRNGVKLGDLAAVQQRAALDLVGAALSRMGYEKVINIVNAEEEFARTTVELHTAQRNPAKFGYAKSYGWSEDKARQAAEPEGQEFNDYLRETWFRF